MGGRLVAGGEWVWGMLEKCQGGTVGHLTRGPATALPTRESSLHSGRGLRPGGENPVRRWQPLVHDYFPGPGRRFWS